MVPPELVETGARFFSILRLLIILIAYGICAGVLAMTVPGQPQELRWLSLGQVQKGQANTASSNRSEWTEQRIATVMSTRTHVLTLRVFAILLIAAAGALTWLALGQIRISARSVPMLLLVASPAVIGLEWEGWLAAATLCLAAAVLCCLLSVLHKRNAAMLLLLAGLTGGWLFCVFAEANHASAIGVFHEAGSWSISALALAAIANGWAAGYGFVVYVIVASAGILIAWRRVKATTLAKALASVGVGVGFTVLVLLALHGGLEQINVALDSVLPIAFVLASAMHLKRFSARSLTLATGFSSGLILLALAASAVQLGIAEQDTEALINTLRFELDRGGCVAFADQIWASRVAMLFDPSVAKSECKPPIGQRVLLAAVIADKVP